jgi:hypothetical protein
MAIVLSISGFSVSLNETSAAEYPRQRFQLAEVRHVATGSVAGTGTHYEPKFVWNLIDVKISREQKDLLEIIYFEHDYTRRHNENAYIVIDDSSAYYTERLPRTRPIVPGTSAIQYPTVSPSHVKYFPRFTAWFTKEPQYRAIRLDSEYKCTLSLIETFKLEVTPQ